MGTFNASNAHCRQSPSISQTNLVWENFVHATDESSSQLSTTELPEGDTLAFLSYLSPSFHAIGFSPFLLNWPAVENAEEGGT